MHVIYEYLFHDLFLCLVIKWFVACDFENDMVNNMGWLTESMIEKKKVGCYYCHIQETHMCLDILILLVTSLKLNLG